MALLTRSPRYQRPVKGASNRPECDPESVLPAGGERGRLPPSPLDFANTELQSAYLRHPRADITATTQQKRLPGRLDESARMEREGRREGGVKKEERRGKTFLIYTTVFLTSIMRPNNCGFGQNRGRRRVDGRVIFMVSFRWRVDRCCCTMNFMVSGGNWMTKGRGRLSI